MSLSLMSRESSSSLGISRSSRFMSTSSSRRVIESSLSTSHSLKTSCQSRSDALTTLTMAASLSRFGRLLLCWVFNSTGSSPTPDGRASAARALPSGESKVISGGWVRRSGGNARMHRAAWQHAASSSHRGRLTGNTIWARTRRPTPKRRMCAPRSLGAKARPWRARGTALGERWDTILRHHTPCEAKSRQSALSRHLDDPNKGLMEVDRR